MAAPGAPGGAAINSGGSGGGLGPGGSGGGSRGATGNTGNTGGGDGMSNDRSGASYDEAQHAAQLQKIMQMVRARPCAWYCTSPRCSDCSSYPKDSSQLRLSCRNEKSRHLCAMCPAPHPPAQRPCCLPPAQRAMHDLPAGGRSNGSNDIGSLAPSSATDERARAEIDRMQQQVGASLDALHPKQFPLRSARCLSLART